MLSVENSPGNPNSFLEPLEKQSLTEVQKLGENAWWSMGRAKNCLFSALLHISSQSGAEAQRETLNAAKTAC